MYGMKSTQVRVMRFDCEIFARVARKAFPASTAWYLSHVTGQSLRTVEKHLRGEAKPGADALLLYLNAPLFGPLLRQAVLFEVEEAGSPQSQLEACAKQRARL